MKKILLAAICLCAIVACENRPENSYKVTGTTSLGNDGDSVFMRHMTTQATDTAILQGGVFVFEGVIDTIENCVLTYRFTGGAVPMSTNFILEKGDINVALDNGARVSGTLLNDRMAEFNDSLKSLNQSARGYQEILKSQTATDEEKQKARETLESLSSQFPNILCYFIEKNADNQVGLMLLSRGANNLEAEKVNELIGKLSDEYKTNPAIVRIQEKIAFTLATQVGKPYTDFSGTTPDGATIKLSDYVAKNKVTLIDFWASWCGPCRAEMPNVVATYKEYHKKGFEIVGVSLDSNGDAWKAAIKNLGITWPQMSDLKGWDCQASKMYGVSGIPATVLIAQDGTILARDLRGEELGKAVKDALK